MASRGRHDIITNRKQVTEQATAFFRSFSSPVISDIQLLLPLKSDEYLIFLKQK